ncbi:MAG TPA: hypothetical protein PKM44_03925 [Turneriella sp.]|nr:hypothetical protein [Turneriella sp.]HNA79979.1 hypothetical protein [Turneriella sp.]HNE19829.1 hypothetical protein [Turneriella sp.]HNJ67204.1 hypothetical protein [Turneriella sp.]HNL09633.1 hypothetical protein [Turneriella sp.]
MGRTVAPYSIVIEQVLSRFENFRRTLRREDREAFDELMRVAKMQVQAGVMAQHPNAFDSMSMAMLVHLKREIRELKKQINTENTGSGASGIIGELYGKLEK